MQSGYNKKLATEWIDWIESSDSSNRKEIFQILEKWVETVQPKVLVDLGCGQGFYAKAITDKIQYIGIDSSETLIERAKKLFPNKKFLCEDIYQTSLKNNSVDATISIWVWSHLEDLKSAANEMYRILKPEGRFLIVTANPETYEERKTFYKKYKITGKLLTGTFDLGKGKFLTDTTLYLHTKEEIEAAIKSADLKINYIKRMGKAETSDKGLYLVIEGSK